MKSLRLPLWLAFLLLVSHATARAQSSVEPITAKQRELSYQIQPDGSRVLKNEQAGVFYRSSAGASGRAGVYTSPGQVHRHVPPLRFASQ